MLTIDLKYSPSESPWLKDIPKPPGFDSNYVPVVKDEVAQATVASKQLAAKQQQVMAMAYAPGKGIMTTAFMLWMSGSSIQIFSLMMTGMALINPINAITGLTKPNSDV